MSALPRAILGRQPLLGTILFGLCFAAILAGFALLGFQAETARLDRLSRQITVAVADADPTRQAGRATVIVAMLRGRDDLQDVRPAKGGDAALIDATLRPGRDETALVHALAGQPGVEVFRDAAAVAPLRAMTARGETLARSALAVLAGLVLLATGVMTGRSKGRPALAVVRRLGADAAQRRSVIRRVMLYDAVIGALAGSAAGAIAMLFIAMQLQSGKEADVAAPLPPLLALASVPIVTLLLAALAVEVALRLDASVR